MKIRIISTSELATKLVPTAHEKSTEENKIFGKIFEECYTEAVWLENYVLDYFELDDFTRNIKLQLLDQGFFSNVLLQKANKMFKALHGKDIVGRKPKTEFRKLRDGIVISGQPDLINENNKITYYEFKTYHIDEFGKVQASIFSWVFKKNVKLVGLVEKPDGSYYAEIQNIPVIKPSVLKSLDLCTMGKYQDFCSNCNRPEYSCRCDYWY